MKWMVPDRLRTSVKVFESVFADIEIDDIGRDGRRHQHACRAAIVRLRLIDLFAVALVTLDGSRAGRRNLLLSFGGRRF